MAERSTSDADAAGAANAVSQLEDSDTWTTHDLSVQGGALGYLDREWVLANGTGAYAMGTLPAINTRRYHGLLVAATRPPVGRVVALSQMYEQLALDNGQVLEWSNCMFRGEAGDVFSPQGFVNLKRFTKGLRTRWEYEQQGVQWTRELELCWKSQSATLRYHIRGHKQKATARLQPMLALRDYHDMNRDEGGDWSIARDGGQVTVRRGDLSVTMRCEGATFEENPQWWRQLFYPADLERGQEHFENLYMPGAWLVQLQPGEAARIDLHVSLGDSAPVDAPRREAHLEQMLAAVEGENDPIKRMLVIAADDFVVDRTVRDERLSTVIAGYPWFTDWGRDTFIALPGLLLTTGRHEEARAVLQAFAKSIKDGLTPNVFDDYDSGAAHYNTVDASLWFVHAALEYLRASDDEETWNDWLAKACNEIIEAYIRGTLFDIKMAGDGLISAGNASTQLTWMDAACDGVVFTPRHGKAVEINALWYSDLMGMATAIENTDPKTADHYERLGKRIKRSFAKVFWDPERGCLRDHVWTDDQGEDHPDEAMRPNQILAVSLPYSPLPRTKQVQVVQAVQKQLLTPYGLRTLPPEDPSYHPHYSGDGFKRDEAYHQGTVWGWLIGPYAEAVLRSGQFSESARVAAQAAIQPLLDHMAGAGLGQIHEIFEGTPPHYPKGCIAQAWSVSEVLRVLRLIETRD